MSKIGRDTEFVKDLGMIGAEHRAQAESKKDMAEIGNSRLKGRAFWPEKPSRNFYFHAPRKSISGREALEAARR
jgi:hypothetical protein